MFIAIGINSQKLNLFNYIITNEKKNFYFYFAFTNYTLKETQQSLSIEWLRGAKRKRNKLPEQRNTKSKAGFKFLSEPKLQNHGTRNEIANAENEIRKETQKLGWIVFESNRNFEQKDFLPWEKQ